MNASYFKELVDVFFSLKEKSEMANFLKAILTPKEQEEISARLQIVKMLKKHVPQREISLKLGVGIATVTRGSLELQKGSFQNIK